MKCATLPGETAFTSSLRGLLTLLQSERPPCKSHRLAYSPIAALNRTYALSKANNKKEAIAEAEKLRLTDNHLYFLLLGVLYRDIDDPRAGENLRKALLLAKSENDRRTIQKNIGSLPG